MGRLPYPYSREDALFFLEHVAPREVVWIVQDHGSGEALGVAGLTPHGVLESAELGYWLGQSYWGSGFATEASRTILKFAFGKESLPEVTSGCFVGNVRSAHVLEKLGFRTIRTSKRSCMAQAKELPHLDMTLTRDRWMSGCRNT